VGLIGPFASISKPYNRAHLYVTKGLNFGAAGRVRAAPLTAFNAVPLKISQPGYTALAAVAALHGLRKNVSSITSPSSPGPEFSVAGLTHATVEAIHSTSTRALREVAEETAVNIPIELVAVPIPQSVKVLLKISTTEIADFGKSQIFGRFSPGTLTSATMSLNASAKRLREVDEVAAAAAAAAETE
jgi:hypothetical protein